MQPAVSAALPPSTTATASPVIAKQQFGPADFGIALANLLATVVPIVTAKVTSAPTPSKMPATAQATTPTPAPAQTTTATTTLMPTLAPTPMSTPKPASAAPVATAVAAVTQLPLPPEGPPPVTEPAVVTPQTGTTVAPTLSTPTTRSTPTKRREPAAAKTATPVAAPPSPVTDAPPPLPAVAIPVAETPAPTPPAGPPSPHDTVQPQADIAAAPPPPAEPVQPSAPQPTDPKPAADDAEPAADHAAVAVAGVAPRPTLPATPTTITPAPTATATPATSTAATATPASPHATTASPVEQIAPALVSLGHAPDGAQRLTMRLQPPELGQVQIRIDSPTPDAPARVAITVERLETLTLLLRDQPQLQRALDQAGVPSEGRSVTFHVATPEPSARTETSTAAPPTGSAASMGGDFSHSASRQGGKQTQGDATVADEPEEIEAIPAAPTNWLRAGLDITA